MEGLPGVALEAVEAPVAAVPSAQQVGVAAPSRAWLFRKAPLGVLSRDADLSVTVPDDGRQYLLWMPTAAWSNGLTTAEVHRWATTSVTVRACSTDVDFLGGVLTNDPARCFPVRFQRTGAAPVTRRISLTAGPCG